MNSLEARFNNYSRATVHTMGDLIEQKPVKLIASIIFKDEEYLECAERMLTEAYGPVEPPEETLPFDFTEYYSEEFGKSLNRKLLCFKKLHKKENIYKVKVATNDMEDVLRYEGKRVVNIDPGYVTEAKLVLLTTKDYTHRVYIGGKIFAESTLFMQDGTFKSWPWTYPDYSQKEMVSYFNKVRDIYMKDVRS